MPTPLPERLIASEAKVRLINENECKDCLLLRRTDLKSLRTPAGEISSDIFSSRDLFGLSVNIYLCNTDELELDSDKGDVLYFIKENPPFKSDTQLKEVEDGILAEKADGLIVGFLLGHIDGLEGKYPFAKGTKKEVFWQYKIKVVQDPLLYNAFHYEVKVFTDENEKREFILVDRNTAKKYVRSMASDVRAELIDNKRVTSIELID